jgi:phosphoenolpyruvate-protein phosphotransferase
MVEICEKLSSIINTDDGRAKTFLEPIVLVVLRTFTPSDILSYDISKIQAVVSVSGGTTSHAAILARSYSIPVVSGIENIQEYIRPGDQLFVDADKASVYIRPPIAVITKFEQGRPSSEDMERLRSKWRRPVYTRDGIHIEVFSNVSLPADADTANSCGADGIGLVRSEYLLTNRKDFPGEQEQVAYYESIFSRSGSKSSVIRVFDIGGDKIPDFFKMPAEFNPFMGWRGIRILLERRDLFYMQLQSIMTAARNSDYAIMLPMVTTLQELIESKKIIAEVAKKLAIPTPPIGVLFEVPLAILEMESFMPEIDFASVGTNDLIQYLSAADRNNPKVNFLYNPIEPAFLKILKSAIITSKDSGKPLSICGEMAGDPFHTVLLIGMGLKRFSVMPRNIPILKELISHISYAEAEEAVSHLDGIGSTKEVATWVEKINERFIGDVVAKLPIQIRI